MTILRALDRGARSLVVCWLDFKVTGVESAQLEQVLVVVYVCRHEEGKCFELRGFDCLVYCRNLR